MVKEFRDFLMRGNLLELAVAFVMGLAFAHSSPRSSTAWSCRSSR